MKRVGYYPALVIILLICMIAVGGFIYLSSITLKQMGSTKVSDATYKAKLKELENAQTALNSNQKADKQYNDYFARWIQKEGQLDEASLKQKLQKMAEDLSLNVFEIVPLNAPENDPAKPGMPKRRLARPENMPGQIPAAAGMPPQMGLNAPGMVELRVTLLGPFPQMMSWMMRAESELGSLRIVQTQWTARSPEEVKLTVGIRYKKIGGAQ